MNAWGAPAAPGVLLPARPPRPPPWQRRGRQAREAGRPCSSRAGARPAARAAASSRAPSRMTSSGSHSGKELRAPGRAGERRFPRALWAAAGARPGPASRRGEGSWLLSAFRGDRAGLEQQARWHCPRRGRLAGDLFQGPEPSGWTGGEARCALTAEAKASPCRGLSFPQSSSPPLRALALPLLWPQGAVDRSKHVTALPAAC